MAAVPVEAIVLGASWGGVAAFVQLLSCLPEDFPLPLVLVQHQHPNSDDALRQVLAHHCRLPVRVPDDKDAVMPGCVHVAAPGHHLLVEPDRRFSYSLAPPRHFCRPAIDELFGSAAWAYGEALLGILLTGANEDGAAGLLEIRQRGGRTAVQDPAEAAAPVMPAAALQCGAAQRVLSLPELGRMIIECIDGSWI